MAAEVPRFILAGGLSTGLHWALMAGLIALGVPAVLATAVGAAAGLLANYFLQRSFTFRSAKRHRSAFPSYLGSAGLGWCINLLVFSAAYSTLFSVVTAQFVATAAAALANYYVMKRYVFQPA